MLSARISYVKGLYILNIPWIVSALMKISDVSCFLVDLYNVYLQRIAVSLVNNSSKITVTLRTKTKLKAKIIKTECISLYC